VLVGHFSDIHLLSLEGARIGDFLGKRATGALNLLLNRGGQFPLAVAEALVSDLEEQAPDHLLVSGDLTNLAFAAEFRLARALLERVRLPASRITLVPGNHDYYARRSAVTDEFGRIMAPFLGGEQKEAGAPGPGARFPLLRLQPGLAVVALSSAVPSAPFMAVGRLGARQLRRAEEILDSEPCRERFRLVVLHHPPAGLHVRWHNRLLDAGPFLALLARTGADLVVHGHLHRFARLELAGPGGQTIPLIGVGSGTWLSPADDQRRAQYNLYEIEAGRLRGVRRRRYEPGRRRFDEMLTPP
jgi:3',5'-cyclic AMP phosphodiesterase CpdA